MITLEKLLGRLLDLTKVLGAIAIFLMMLHITTDVVARFVFWKSPPGTLIFVSKYYMVIVAFLSLAVAERSNQHITVEVVSEHFPMRVQNGFNLMAAILSLIVFALIAYRGWDEAVKKQSIGAFILEQDVRIPIWPSYYILTLGAALMCLTLLFKIARHLTFGKGRSVTDPFESDLPRGSADY